MSQSDGAADGNRQDLEALLAFIRETHGFDADAYKRTSLTRRINARMSAVNVEGYREYLDLLQAEPTEFPKLLDTILINVTSFFRDPEAWQVLSEKAIRTILDARRAEEPIRIWSAGCSSGEEAYTIAIAFTEAMGVDEAVNRLKIYATDIDEAALETARSGRYSATDVEAIPKKLLAKYFSASAARPNRPHEFDRALRKTVIFGRHDLLSDPPISKLDLIVCRNTLMYFNADTQREILRRFHFALRDEHSSLFLGKAESLMTGSKLFRPVDSKVRLFRKLPVASGNGREYADAGEGKRGMTPGSMGTGIPAAAFSAGNTAQLVVGDDGSLVMASDRARDMFGLTDQDIGGQFSDLPMSYRPIEFRSLMDQARNERTPVQRGPVEWPRGRGRETWVRITVTPLFDAEGAHLGAKLEIEDVTELQKATEDLRKAQQELETFQEELQSANEELEAANEELQSTVEELETTNEELQSTNEELETMNDEIRSTNEELNTANLELMRRSDEADRANRLLSDVTSGLMDALMVIGSELEVQIWSEGASELWGVSADETVGRQFFDLDIGLPVSELRADVEMCLSGKKQEVSRSIEAIDRRGKPVTCQLRMRPLNRESAKDGMMIAVSLAGEV